MTALTHDSFAFQHPRDCRIDPGARWGRIGGIWAMLTCRWRLTREVRVLRGLTDHQLNDIGLSRSEVGGSDESLHSSDQTIRILSGR